MKIGLVLTQWKRNNLKYQLDSIYKQTLKPHYIVVFQNENHVDISDLKKQYNFIHVKSDYNTKYFGRFSYFFTLPVDICIVMDDDIIPGKNCIKNYIEQCINDPTTDCNALEEAVQGFPAIDYMIHHASEDDIVALYISNPEYGDYLQVLVEDMISITQLIVQDKV